VHAESHSATVKGGDHKEVTYQNLLDYLYSLTAYAHSGWRFDGSFNISGFNGWSRITDSDSTKSVNCLRASQNQATLFPVVISGRIIPVGSGEGPPPPTDWSLKGKAEFDYRIAPLEALKAMGESATFYSYDGDTPTPSYWGVAAFGEGVTCGGTASSNFSTPLVLACGLHHVKGQAEADSSQTDTAVLRIVGVKSVTAEKITSETDSPGADETVYVPVGAEGSTVTVTAAPDPDGEWPDNKPTWTGATGEDGSATAAFPISTISADANGTTVTATCGSSAKAMKICVVGVKSVSSGGITSETDSPGESETLRVPVNANVDVTAASEPTDSNWPENKPTWTGATGEDGSATATVDTSTPSTTTEGNIVTATCGASSKAMKVCVVGVKNVSAEDITSTTDNPGNNETLYVPVGSSSIEITPEPEPEGDWPDDFPTWTGATGEDGSNTADFTDTAQPGTHTIEATCGNSKAMKIVVVGVKEICHDDSSKKSDESLEVSLGENETVYSAPYVDVDLTANPDPDNANWPDETLLSDYPSWNCECGWPICSHLTEDGDKCTFNSSSTGDYIVSCSCGDSIKRIKISNLLPKLNSVEFDGITIKKDKGGSYDGAEWIDSDLNGTIESTETKYPVAFASNGGCTVSSVKFKLEGSRVYDVPMNNIKIRFDSGWLYSYSDETNGALSGGEITATNISRTGPFHNSAEVDYQSSFEIDWDISFNGGSDWYNTIGTSENELYLTWKTPETTETYETVLHIGCTNASGETDAEDIVSKIWGEFSDTHVKRKNSSNDMQYWGSIAITKGIFTTAELLLYDDGRCGAWQDFIVDVFEAQGITSIIKYHLFADTTTGTYPNLNISTGFLVKNWSFSGVGTSGNAMYPYLQSECTDELGIRGQGNDNPRSLFWDHAVIYYSGTIYDPSYGTTAANLSTYSNNSLSGWLDNSTGFVTNVVSKHNLSNYMP
jgi:hypothetical protein